MIVGVLGRAPPVVQCTCTIQRRLRPPGSSTPIWFWLLSSTASPAGERFNAAESPYARLCNGRLIGRPYLASRISARSGRNDFVVILDLAVMIGTPPVAQMKPPASVLVLLHPQSF